MYLKDKEVCIQGPVYNKTKIQAFLRNIVGSIPDQRNKVNIAIKRVTNFLVSQHI